MKSEKILLAQSCLTPCDPMDLSLPGSSVHRILQARILEWVAISFSRGSSNPGIEPRSPASQADSLPSEPPGKPLLKVKCLQLAKNNTLRTTSTFLTFSLYYFCGSVCVSMCMQQRMSSELQEKVVAQCILDGGCRRLQNCDRRLKAPG